MSAERAAVGRRRLIWATGPAVALLYLAGAALSGHLSPSARRPVLDGFGHSAAYRWVKPPPALAATNQPPERARASFAFKGGSLQGGVVSTNDLQATLILQDGSVTPSAGQASVRVTIDPLDPAKLGGVPSGLTFDGNAYRVLASYQPRGGRVGSLTVGADLALYYPADATFGLGSLKHVILSSPNGRDWHVLSTQDLPGSQQATAKAFSFGYFVVGRSGGPATAKGGSSIRWVPIVVAGVVVLLILLFTSPRVIRRFRRKGRDDMDFGQV